MHVGSTQTPGGRVGDRPSVKLAERIDSFGLPLGRLKTGTPPRLSSMSINWSVLESQSGDDVRGRSRAWYMSKFVLIFIKKPAASTSELRLNPHKWANP